MIVGVPIPRAIVGLGGVLVGLHHLGQVAVAVVEAALYAAVLLDPPDLPVEQVVFYPGPAPLLISLRVYTVFLNFRRSFHTLIKMQ